MVIVNIKVPALEKVYNFSVDERARVDDLVEEIVEMVKQKEGIQFRGDLSGIVLCSGEKGISFERARSLGDYGICGGEELILV